MRLRVLPAAAATLLLASAAAFAQAPAAKKQPSIEDLTVKTGDGWTLPITYFSNPNKETPAVILLHGRDGSRGVWRGLAEALKAKGYAVVSVDLRKHGESQPPAGTTSRSTKVTPADHQNMVRFDLEAVKNFLLARHQAEELNIRKTAVVAADDGAPVAANWALTDWLKKPFPDAPTVEASTPNGQDIRAVVFLSPTEGVGGLNLGKAVPKLRAFGVAGFVAVGELDKDDRKAAMKTYERLLPPDSQVETEKRVEFHTYPQVKARGVELLGATRGRTQQQIIAFLDQHLRKLPDKWQNRKSRLR